VKQSITITCGDNGGYILFVDGGSIECETKSEVMALVGHEMGMTFARANKEIFDAYQMLKKERAKIMDTLSKLEAECADLRHQNAAFKAAIVKWFVRAFNKEG
jgi:predicted Zn-dependent protease